MHKFYKILLTLILSISIVLSCLPMTAFAAENPEEENKIISEAAGEPQATIVTEVVDERASDKKVFLLSDGSYLAAFYPQPVHVQKDGKWEDINNSFVLDETEESGYANQKNNFKIKFSKKAKDKKLVSIKKEDYKIDWALIGAEKVDIQIVSSEREQTLPTSLKNINGTVIYKNILSDTDLKYTVTPLKIKEDIIIKSANAPDSFTFNYEFKNLSYRVTQENTIELYDENSGETVFLIDAPFMYDAAGVYSGDIELKISETDKGIELVLIPDNEWISDKERVFPVVIDPTMPLDYNYLNIRDATVSFETRANTVGASSLVSASEKAYLKVGRRYTDELGAVIYHDVENKLPKGVNVVNAQLSFLSYRSGLSTCGSNLQINAYEILSDWGQTTTTGNMVLFKGETPGTPNHSTTVLDYIIYNDASSSADAKWYTFDITKAVQRWCSGYSENLGIMLCATGLGSSEQFARFYDSDNGVTGTDPVLSVTYRDAVGLESYWSYVSQSIGEYDAGYVNIYNGNLVYAHNIAAFNSEINGFTLSLIYNSFKSKSNWAYCGSGWKLNLIQTFKTVTIKDNSYVKYVYTDADGTEHYFVQNSDGTIVDEDGLGLTYSNNSSVDSTMPHKITDKDKNAYYFNSKGYLCKIADSNNNYISLTYTDVSSTEAKLTSVTTSSGGLITLQYDSNNLLYKITDNAQRTTEFTFVGKTLGYIKHPDGRVTAFNYDDSRLIGVVPSDNPRTYYDYNTKSGKVIKIRNYGKNKTAGNFVDFSYAYNQTTVKDSTGKEITYQFDIFGRPVCVYDKHQNIYSQTYTQNVETGSGIFANNKLATSSNGTVYVNNLITDPTFSNGMSSWSYYSNSSFSDYSVVTSSSLLSSNSILLATSGSDDSYICQNVETSAGKTYTLSANVKLVCVDSEGYGAGLEILTSNGRYLYNLKTGTADDSVDNGFEKISLTVALEEGETISRVGVGMFQSWGAVYVDSVQLEEGETANTLNLLSNSSFEANGGNGTLPTGFISPTGTAIGDVTDIVKFLGGGSYTMEMGGGPSADRNMYQTVNVSGKKGDVYSFGGWVKAHSIAPHSSGNAATFEIAVKVYNTDSTVDWISGKFNTYISDWQFTQKAFVAKKDYTKLDVYVKYGYNCNFAYFDNLFLYRDTMQSYTYDSNGNVISTADYASQNSEYGYYNNNLEKMISPTGSGYEYLFNSKNNLIASRSSEGLQYNIYYDSQGNPTSAVLRNNNYSTTLQSGKTYYIRLKCKGKYLTVENSSTSESANVVIAPFTGGANQRWKLEKTDDGAYYLIPEHCETKCLNVAGGSNVQKTNIDIYTKNNSDAQKFVITAQNDYTYVLCPKSSDDGKRVTVNFSNLQSNVSIVTKQGENNVDQEWFFEDTENEPITVLEDGGIYQFRGFYTGKYLNAQFAAPDANTNVSQTYHSHDNNLIYQINKWENTEFYTLTPLSAPDKLIEVGTELNALGYEYLKLGDGTVTDRKLFKFEYNSAKQGFLIIPKYNEAYSLNVNDTAVGEECVMSTKSTGDSYIYIPESVSDAITSSSTYQNNGNYIHTVTDSRGNTTTYNYDTQRGTLTGVQDAKGNTVSYSYNQLNDRLNSVTSGTSSVSYEYELYGGIKKITSPGGTVYNFTYDEFGRNVGISVGSENLSTTTYKDNFSSLIKEFEYGNGVKKEYTYDTQDRLVSEKIGGIEKVKYIYDKRSNVAQVNDYYVNVTTDFSYDLIGRIIGIASTDGQKVNYSYDNFNRLKMSKWSLNNISLTSEYIYGDTAVSGQKAGLIYGVKTNGIEELKYTYDELCRLETRTLETTTPYVTEYSYLEGAGIHTTTTLIKTVKNGNDTLEYAYDELGNITSVKKNNVVIESYTYDSLNQLTGATYGGDTYVYTYDNGGNILSVTKNGTVIKTYTYGNANWKDLLTQYNGYTITYDTIGNPIQYRDGYNFSWSNGRQLSTVTNGANSYSYTYNADSLRTSKTVNGVTTNYYWSNGILQAQKTGDEYIIFLYDENGSAYGFLLKNGATEEKYYYIFNAQGDVIGIVDSTGTQVVNYTYGAWGDILSVTGTLASTIGEKNPLRYRGYYYDAETGLYYVSSRYYDPEICRFINADIPDVITATPMTLTDKNLFAYCDNNPVVRVDSNGDFWNTVIGLASGAIVGGVSALIMGTDVTAGIVSGALSGAVSGAAIDITIATGGVGLVALAGVVAASGVGGGVSSYVNQRMNGVEHDKVDWGTVAIDSVWGAIGGALSFGMADVGGKACKTLAENLASSGRNLALQASSDFATAVTISSGTWLNGTKMNMLYKRIG